MPPVGYTVWDEGGGNFDVGIDSDSPYPNLCIRPPIVNTFHGWVLMINRLILPLPSRWGCCGRGGSTRDLPPSPQKTPLGRIVEIIHKY